MPLKPALEFKDPARAAARRGRLPRWVVVTSSLILFGGAFLGARTLVAQGCPWEPDGEVADKLAAYERRASEFNTVFVGSSRVFRQVDPATFDAGMAELGYGTRSFNFGAAGMTAIEMRDYLRRILDIAPDTLRLVVISPETVEGSLADENVPVVRVIAWHDTWSTRLALRSALGSEASVRQKARWVYNHLASYLTNLSGAGQVLAAVEADPDPRDRTSLGLGGDGWLSLDDYQVIGSSAERRQLEARRAQLQKMGEEGLVRVVQRLTAAAEAAQVDTRPPGEVEEVFLTHLVELVRSAGAEPIFVVPPGGGEYATGWLLRAQRAGMIPVVLDFADPRRHPDLFRFDAWFDRNHLNREASLRFSGYLAEEMAAYLAEAVPGLELPPSPTVEVGLDFADLAAASTGLVLDGGTLVKSETRAFLGLPGVEAMGGTAVEVAFGPDTRQPGGQLQVQRDSEWSRLSQVVTAPGGGVLVFDLGSAPHGAAVRLRVTGGVGTRIETVRVLGVMP